MRNNFFSGLSALLIVLAVTGCSKVPQAEIDAAKAAVAEAKAAGADIYLSDSFVALEDTLNAVIVQIQEQESKVFKNYNEEVDQLTAVANSAKELIGQTEARKEALKVEIQGIISEVRTLLEVNRGLVLEAPRGKEGTTVLTAIKGELNTIEESVNEVTAMVEKGDYLPSLDKAKAAKEKVSAINVELTEVIQKYKANVSGKKG